MMSPTVMPSRRSVTRALTDALRAEPAMSQPRIAHQIALPTSSLGEQQVDAAADQQEAEALAEPGRRRPSRARGRR